MTISVTPLQKEDRKDWQTLYQGYADFYQVPMTDAILDQVWSWIFDKDFAFFALIAKDDRGKAIGLMHAREMPSPLRGKMVGFLDDLFVDPDYRGSGCVQALYEALDQLGQQRAWPFIRWITAENNYRARNLYDKIAEKTPWLTYQMPVTGA